MRNAYSDIVENKWKQFFEEQKKEDRQPDFPTLNSLNSAICAMKDVFKWISLQVKNN